MILRCALALLAWLTVAPAFAAPPREVAILAGHLLAEPGRPARGASTVLVRDGRIRSVLAGIHRAALPCSPVCNVDLSTLSVMPGLIDAHQHLAIGMDAPEGTYGSPVRLEVYVADYAERLLAAGVTTVRDAGDNTGTVVRVRDAVRAGRRQGPRIIAAGRIVSRAGGHGVDPPQPGDFPYTLATCNTPSACRSVVDANIRQGSDWIKIAVSGSGREPSGRAGAAPIMRASAVRSAVAAAHSAGIPVAAHAHSAASILLALEAGARSIEHGTYFDARSAALFRKRHAYIVPTSFIADYVRGNAARFAGGPAMATAGIRAWTFAALAVPARAWRSHVPLGLGTDAGPSFPTDATAREVGLYVRSGVPARAALAAATVGNADLLGLGSSIGRVAPGYAADLIAVDGDPERDVDVLRAPRFVMHDGRVVVPAADGANAAR